MRAIIGDLVSMAHDVFISYAAEDKATADAICQTLEAQGVGCWYAPRNVPYGVDFEEAIVEAITKSRFMVLVISAHSIQSRHVRREVQVANRQEAEVPIIPFRIQDVPLNNALTYYLSSVHRIDASTPQLETHLQHLVEYVQAQLGQQKPDELSPLPPAPPLSPPDVQPKPWINWPVLSRRAVIICIICLIPVIVFVAIEEYSFMRKMDNSNVSPSNNRNDQSREAATP